MDADSLAAKLDQTLLKPTIGLVEGGAWIEEMAERGFATLCVAPFLVPAAAARLADTQTAVCSVVAFPLGYARSRAKADEAADLVSMGCREVDVVINIAALLEQDEEFVLRDIAAVVEAVAKVDDAALVKVILETGYLAADDIRRGCVLAVAAGARFVKTSTGFGPRGASVEDVRIMRQAVGLDFGVKAAGGIRSLDDALALLAAGADRIGTSVGDVLVDAAAQRGL